VEQRGPLVVADAEILHQLGREDVGKRAQRDALGGRMSDRPLDAPTGALGEAQRLFGETGLADARRTEQDHSAARPVAVERAQLLEFDGAARQRPRRDHPRTAAARATTLLPSQPIGTGRDAT
jgi:hypothetical protein